MERIRNEKGVAILTALFVLLIVTALAAGAIMLATVQLKVSGSIRFMEERQASLEGGIDHIIPLVQFCHYCDKSPCPAPDGYSSNVMIANPDICEKLSNPIYANRNDRVDTAPNISNLEVGDYTVDIDIDSMGTAMMPGGSMEPSQAYHKSAENPTVSAYRITTLVEFGQDTSNMCQVVWLKSVM